MRRAAKVDGNHCEIVKALRKANIRVLSLAGVGKGCPDILALCRDKLFLVEIKRREAPGHALRFKKAQLKFYESWPVIVAETAEQAINEIIRRAE